MTRVARSAFCAITSLLVAGLAGCSSQEAVTPAPPRVSAPSRERVLATLTDERVGDTSPAWTLYAPPEPTRLRPCCAFGQDLQVAIGFVPVPGVSLETTRGPADVGPHEYRPGLLQITPGPVSTGPDRPSREHNGIAYTCRGGFVDTAHIRDFSDLTWYLAAQVDQRLETGGTIDLADLGGKRRIVVKPVPPQRMLEAGRTELSVALAQWLTFELSIWREIATWYGHESVPPWPEKISAFSIEDLYSNMIGTKIAGGIVRAGPIDSELDYERAMSAWIPAVLDVLAIVPKQSAAAAMHAVDGIWWDSGKRIPDWKLLRRRKLDLPTVPPWLLEMAETPSPIPDLGCPAREDPLILHRVDSIGGISIRDQVEIDILPSDHLARNGFPFPRPGDRRVTPADFASIAAHIRRKNDVAFGVPSNGPRASPVSP